MRTTRKRVTGGTMQKQDRHNMRWCFAHKTTFNGAGRDGCPYCPLGCKSQEAVYKKDIYWANIVSADRLEALSLMMHYGTESAAIDAATEAMKALKDACAVQGRTRNGVYTCIPASLLLCVSVTQVYAYGKGWDYAANAYAIDEA